MRSVFQSFYARLTLALMASFIVIGVLLFKLVEELTIAYENEVEQELHYDLAYHVVKDHQLFDGGEIDQAALKLAFHNMMVLGPAFEFYVLDPAGKILTYSADPGKVKLDRVSLSPVNAFLNKTEMLPILGDDPRAEGRKKIFSVAPIFHQDQLVAYLYIIIGGELYDSVVDVLKNSHIMQIGVWGGLAGLAFILVILLVVFALMTQPLRRLTQDMQTFKDRGFDSSLPKLTDWQANGDEIQRLGASFNDLVAELSAQYEKVKTTDELRKELISYVSHDLRTPLAALLGYLETWQEAPSDMPEEERRRLIQIAIDNGHHISHLVDQLFELARLDSDNVSLQREPVAIAELAFDVMQNLKGLADSKGVGLVVDPEDTSLLVLADVAKLERVLVNLLDNAIRHCGSGDIVSVILTPKDKGVEIAVRDTGCGIPLEDLPHIFQAHYRARNSVKSKKGNTGLGLAITRRILELHGSEIAVESQERKGTTLRFVLGGTQ